jgi:hypothetical protein
MELKFIRIFRKYSDYHCSLISRDLERKFDPMMVEWGNYEGIVIADLLEVIPYFWIPVISLSAYGEACNNYRQVSIPMPRGSAGPVTG